MKYNEYKQWLELQKYQANTINAQMHRAKKVDDCYGDLDNHFETDKLESVIRALKYTSEDRRRNLPNPSKIPFDGDPHNNLASYRNAVERYRRFRLGGSMEDGADSESSPWPSKAMVSDKDDGQRIGLERDMQAALRIGIEQLENGLSIIDEGAEKSVDSGFIDITAKDINGTTVVIELKTGVAGQRAVAQILSYMGDVFTEEMGAKVRGILVASGFDSKAKAAAKMIPHLSLKKYSVRFTFSDGHD
jgi:hypothetical protein